MLEEERVDDLKLKIAHRLRKNIERYNLEHCQPQLGCTKGDRMEKLQRDGVVLRGSELPGRTRLEDLHLHLQDLDAQHMVLSDEFEEYVTSAMDDLRGSDKVNMSRRLSRICSGAAAGCLQMSAQLRGRNPQHRHQRRRDTAA